MHSTKELAEKIRHHVDFDFASKVHPDRVHLHNTAVAVAEELGMDPNHFNIGHLTSLIAEHVPEPSKQFPKMKYHHGDKVERVVHDTEEEKSLGEGWVDHHWSAPA